MGNRRRWPVENWDDFLASGPEFKLVYANHRARMLIVQLNNCKLRYPFALLDPQPSVYDRFDRWYTDEAQEQSRIWYVLHSGKKGVLTVEQVLEFYREPSDLKQRMLSELTLAALEEIKNTGFSQRQILKRLRTSPSQLSRILDPSNERKSVDGILALLEVLGCKVDVRVRRKRRNSS